MAKLDPFRSRPPVKFPIVRKLCVAMLEVETECIHKGKARTHLKTWACFKRRTGSLEQRDKTDGESQPWLADQHKHNPNVHFIREHRLKIIHNAEKAKGNAQ